MLRKRSESLTSVQGILQTDIKISVGLDFCSFKFGKTGGSNPKILEVVVVG